MQFYFDESQRSNFQLQSSRLLQERIEDTGPKKHINIKHSILIKHLKLSETLSFVLIDLLHRRKKLVVNEYHFITSKLLKDA